MRKACFGLILLAGLSVPAAASAADNMMVGVGSGALAGALVAGPVGAVVGAVAGGVIGSNTPSTRRRHARRTRPAHRRRAAAPVSTQRATKLAERGPIGSGPGRAHARGSEISTGMAPATTGSSAAAGASKGWQDPH